MIIEDKLMKYVLFQKRTEYEVKQKCKTLKYSDENIEEIINYLLENKYLDDENYVDRYIKNVMRLKNCSILEIKMDLKKRGIKEELIEKGITEELEEFETKSARVLANKKIKNSDSEKVKRYLMNKGYSHASVAKAIDNSSNLDDN